MANAFYETRNLYIQYTRYVRPLSFEEWLAVPEDQKAAVLFVQFFDEITLAWNKVKSFYTLEEDGVYTMNQYLIKNVPLIVNNEKRFNSKYIYRVAYNCLYCICHDIKRDKERWECETSNIVDHDGDELDLFDTVVSRNSSTEDIFLSKINTARFWAIIESCDLETQKVIEYLTTGDPKSLKKVSKTCKAYQNAGPLRDIEVSLDRVEDILVNLRNKLAEIKSDFNM